MTRRASKPTWTRFHDSIVLRVKNGAVGVVREGADYKNRPSVARKRGSAAGLSCCAPRNPRLFSTAHGRCGESGAMESGEGTPLALQVGEEGSRATPRGRDDRMI